MFLIQVTGGQIVFVPTKIMAEFVEVGKVNFVDEGITVLFGKIPEITEE